MIEKSLPVVSIGGPAAPVKQVRAPERPTNLLAAIMVHLARMAMLGLLLLGLHRLAKASHRVDSGGEKIWQSLSIANHLPQATSVVPSPDDSSLRHALDSKGDAVAKLAISSPTADHIIGYSGPTSLLMVISEGEQISDIQVLRSFDTPEHLQQVIASEEFWAQFKGWKWGQESFPHVDGVSGATLTSLAIAESIVTVVAAGSRSDASQPTNVRRSLKFPNDLTRAEAFAWQAPEVVAEKKEGQGNAGARTILTDAPDELGRIKLPLLIPKSPESSGPIAEPRWVIRTGPLSDDISGYQGPTEMLFCVDNNHRLTDARIRSSFDNEPYVRYTKQERSFWKRFKGRSLQELAALDLKKESIDGVSGATMTSVAVAETIREASEQWLQQWEASQAKGSQPPTNVGTTTLRKRAWNFSFGEWCTIALAIAVIPWSASKWRGDRRWRIVWQVISFTGISIVSGNLLSIALLSGWTRGGLSYHLAPGLVTLLVISFAMAILSKRNVYCDHLCPHGILQQWIRPRGRSSARGLRLPFLKLLSAKPTMIALNASAFASIALACAVLVRPWNVNLAWLEPFDAYLLGLGFSLSSLVAIASLVAARTSPMYYCRTACPTGKILAYTRRDSRSHQVRIADGLLMVACTVVWVS